MCVASETCLPMPRRLSQQRQQRQVYELGEPPVGGCCGFSRWGPPCRYRIHLVNDLENQPCKDKFPGATPLIFYSCVGTEIGALSSRPSVFQLIATKLGSSAIAAAGMDKDIPGLET